MSTGRRAPLIWTIGSGGLLGSAITRLAANRFSGAPVPWSNPDEAARTLTEQLRGFSAQAADGPWAIIWAAGRASVASSATETTSELHVYEQFVDAVGQHLPIGPGAVFVTSSAGGVFAGSTNPPFSAHTAPRPLSAYGELKLAQEQLATERLADRCPVVIGRFSNLYGPGQDLGKLQGLISRLALAAVTKEPVNMFVSLDTIRDYLYIDDAAALALDAVERALESTSSPSVEPETRTLVLASGQPTSLGQLITTMQDVTRTRIPIALGAHASAAAQSRDLRLVRTDAERTRHLIRTPLPVGAKRVHLDILQRAQQAEHAMRSA